MGEVAWKGFLSGALAAMLTLAVPVACLAQDDVIDTESDESVVVLEIEGERKAHLVCKGKAGEKNWIFLNAPEVAPEVTFLRPGDEYCLANGAFVFPMEGDSSEKYFSDALPGDRIDLGIFDPTGYGPLAITTATGPSADEVDLIQTIVLLPRGLRAGSYPEEEILVDPDSLEEDELRGTVARREAGSKKAYVVHVTSGLIQGIALRCYDSGSLVFSGFKSFSDAVRLGNSFIGYRELPGELEEAPENPEEVAAVEEEGSELKGCTNIEKENVRIAVCPAGFYYKLVLFINDTRRIFLYKPCNKCPRFNFETGLSHAQSLVNSLQGWD